MSLKKSSFPEEKIRISLLEFMKKELGYPSGVISVERSLSSLPHLKGQKVPNRRFDIAVFSKENFKPLLIIECKAVPITKKCYDQIIGYNHLVQVPFIAIANQQGVITLLKEKDSYKKIIGLPNYNYLLEIGRGWN